MKRFVFALIVIVNCQLSIVNYISAQENFLVRLKNPVTGQGTVTIRQDAEIESLIFGKRNITTLSSLSQNSSKTIDGLHKSDTTETEASVIASALGRKVRMNGYRVQVYAGGNSRDAKRRAYQMEGVVKSLFPNQPVYTRFVSPRWICHVGDFQTRAEALELLSDLKKTGKFPEAITVRCKINAFVHEE